jgi:hypothetical protein
MSRKLILAFLLLAGFAQYANSRSPDFTIAPGYPKPRIVTPTSISVTIRVISSIENEIPVLDQTPSGRIFDITGKEVRTMDVLDPNSMYDSGYSDLVWQPDLNIPAGVYIYQIESSSGYIYNGTIVVAK